MLTWFKTVHRREDDRLYKNGVCLSTDDKPIGSELGNGSRLFEMDTGKTYRYDELHRKWLCPEKERR